MSWRRPPRLELLLELEELPRVRVVAETDEDEQRLLVWLRRPETRYALLDALLDRLDQLEREAA